MSYYKEQLKTFLKDRDFKSGKVLGVGCMNDDLKYFKSFTIDEMVTMDIDPEMKPGIVADINDVITDSRPYYNKFDDVLTFELWEYVYDPIQALKNCNLMLKKDGRLWISAPFIYPTHNPMDEDYLRFTEYFWKKALPLTGFEIVEYERRVWKEARPFLEAVNKDGMRPAKQYLHHNITGHCLIAKKIR